jgi:hypothetical protein
MGSFVEMRRSARVAPDEMLFHERSVRNPECGTVFLGYRVKLANSNRHITRKLAEGSPKSPLSFEECKWRGLPIQIPVSPIVSRRERGTCFDHIGELLRQR